MAGMVEVTNLHDLQAEAMLYVGRYFDLLKELKSKIENTAGMGGINTVLHDYASILRIDTVMMQAGPADRPMRILLLSPTHPLRVLWLYQFETLVRGWIDRMKGKKSEEIKLLIDEDVLEKLTSLNVPMRPSLPRGR